MEQRVVVATGCAVERLVGAFGWEFEGMPEANGTARLELPIVEVKPCLFGGSPPAKPIANTSTREEPGLRGGRQLIPKFLRVDFIDGVGEPALKGADLSK